MAQQLITCSFHREPELSVENLHGGLQLLTTPVTGDTAPLFDLRGLCSYKQCIEIHAKMTLMLGSGGARF